jgi:hypothetical protein
MMIDFGKLTNSEASRTIAEIRGWRVEEKDGRAYLYNPADQLVNYYPTEGLAWAQAPRFASNLNVAWTLFAEIAHDEQFTTVGLQATDPPRVILMNEDVIEWWSFIEETPARAICEAWLWWHEHRALELDTRGDYTPDDSTDDREEKIPF